MALVTEGSGGYTPPKTTYTPSQISAEQARKDAALKEAERRAAEQAAAQKAAQDAAAKARADAARKEAEKKAAAEAARIAAEKAKAEAARKAAEKKAAEQAAAKKATATKVEADLKNIPVPSSYTPGEKKTVVESSALPNVLAQQKPVVTSSTIVTPQQKTTPTPKTTATQPQYTPPQTSAPVDNALTNTPPTNTPPTNAYEPTYEPPSQSGGNQPQFNMTQEQQQVQSEAITSVDSIMSGYSQLQSDARSMGDEGLVALAAQWEKMSQMLDGLEAQIVSQIQGQMNGDDPAMQNALKLIRDEAERMRKETLDELNARGLVQSGVYARALADMNKNELSQVQSAVASRFGDLQTQLNNAIMSLAQTRISALGANQSAINSMMMNTQNNVLTTGLAGLNSAISMRGQDMQNNQFYQQLNQNQNQFNQQLNQNQSQFDSSMKYNYAGLNQNQSQFDSTMSLNRDKLLQDNQQFYAQLNQADKQFYDQLDVNKKLGYAQIEASKGSQAAANTVAQQRLEWEKQMYQQERTDTTNATSQANTYTQVGNAMAPGGFVENAINKIVSGSASVDSISQILRTGGYTQDAQATIISTIQSDPRVQKKLSTPAPSSGASSNYTPSSGSGYTPLGGGYYRAPDGSTVFLGD